MVSVAPVAVEEAQAVRSQITRELQVVAGVALPLLGQAALVAVAAVRASASSLQHLRQSCETS
jgi:hypothetical protein